MGYYKSPPVLDETEQAEFDKYLVEQYQQDIALASQMVKLPKAGDPRTIDSQIQLDAFKIILDKLATPRIYLLQAWLHKRSQEQAGVETK